MATATNKVQKRQQHETTTKTVFDICLRYDDYGNYSNNVQSKFDINATDCFGHNLPFVLYAKKVNAADVEFVLTLNNSSRVVSCATFSVESTTNNIASSGSTLHNVGRFEGKPKFCQVVNLKCGDVMSITLPNVASWETWVRCTIKFDENGKAEMKESPSPSIALQLFRDAMTLAHPDQFADAILTTADDRNFHVHSCFLAKQSSVFNAMLQDKNFKEGKERHIKTPDINSATMEEILRYVYTECVNFDALKVMAPEILYATEKYHLPEPLKLQCTQSMIDSVNVSNALSFLITADLYSLIDLKRCAIKVVVGNLNQIRKQDGWKEILKKQPDLVDEIFAFTASCLSIK